MGRSTRGKPSNGCAMLPSCFAHTITWTGIGYFRAHQTWRCRRLVYMGLSLAHLLVDAPLPEVGSRTALRRFRCADVVHRMPSTLLADHRAGVDEGQAAALYFSLKDSWWERWWFGLMLCRDRSPMITTPPAWFRWRTSLARLARPRSPLHWTMRSLFPPRFGARSIVGSSTVVSHLLVGTFWEAYLPMSTQEMGSACWCLAVLPNCSGRNRHHGHSRATWSRRDVERLPGTPGLSEHVCIGIWTRRMLEFSLSLAILNPS